MCALRGAEQQASPHKLLETTWQQSAVQVAEQQGAYLAKELNKLAQGKSQAAAMPPFEFKQLGSMAQVGELGGLTARVLQHSP